jgi:hypothetical protein
MRIATPLPTGLTLAVLILGSGCAAGQSSSISPTPKSSPMLAYPGGRSSLIDQEELASVEAGSTLLQAVRRLRPEFLRRHATPVPGDVEGGYAAVYLDGVRLGGLGALETIAAATVTELRYLRAGSASDELGRNHRGGVILVSTNR